MKCHQCGGQINEEIGTHPYIGDELPSVILVGVKLRTCTECGATSVGIPKLAKLHRALATNMAKSEHRLAPGEIRFLRKHLGWSGQDAARKLGVTPETVSRRENGAKPMGAPTERLLRLTVLTVDPVDEYPIPDELEGTPREHQIIASLDNDWQIDVA